MNTTHALIAILFGFVFVVLIRSLSRRGRLSMRYTLGWLSIGILALLYPGLLWASREISQVLQVQPLAILLGVPLIVTGLVCIQLSISVSGLTEQVRTLAESVAILEAQSSQNTRSPAPDPKRDDS